jgi:hypothetical protein
MMCDVGILTISGCTTPVFNQGLTDLFLSKKTRKFSNIECDEFVCMPNHVHFVAATVGADLRVRPILIMISFL